MKASFRVSKLADNGTGYSPTSQVVVMIRFPCPNCGEMVEASNQKAGLAVVCSRCRSLVAAPLPAKEQQSAKSAPWLCPLCGTDQKPEWAQSNKHLWMVLLRGVAPALHSSLLDHAFHSRQGMVLQRMRAEGGELRLAFLERVRHRLSSPDFQQSPRASLLHQHVLPLTGTILLPPGAPS